VLLIGLLYPLVFVGRIKGEGRLGWNRAPGARKFGGKISLGGFTDQLQAAKREAHTGTSTGVLRSSFACCLLVRDGLGKEVKTG